MPAWWGCPGRAALRPWPSLWEYNPSQKVSSGQPIPTHFCINIAHRAWSYSLKGGEIRLRRTYNQEFWCQAYLYISSNPAGWESESTTSTLKVCSSQREKVLLRRGCTVVLEAPRTFAHGGESLPVASTMLRSRGHQHHGWRGHLLDSRSFLWEKKSKDAAHGSECTSPARVYWSWECDGEHKSRVCARGGVCGRPHVCTACACGAAASSAALDKTELCKV